MTEIKMRRGTSANWTSVNLILASGEIGYETDTGAFKIGDGTNVWEDRPYFLNVEGLLVDFATKDASSLNVGELDDGRLNQRLGVNGLDLATSHSNNWNNITETGFYWAQGTQTNAPENNPLAGNVFVIDANNQIQVINKLDVDAGDYITYYRCKVGGVWGVWTVVSNTPEQWIAVSPLGDTWVNYDAASEHSLAYRKIGDRVEFRGQIADGASSSTIFTLPSGYRPSKGVRLRPAFSSFQTTLNINVRVQANGNVQVVSYNKDSTNWVSFDGLSFSTL